MKKFIVGFICGALIFSSIGVFANSNIERITAKFNPDLPIYLNGEKLPLENGAINYQDTNYLSIRETAEILGLEVNWNYEAQAVELRKVIHDDYVDNRHVQVAEDWENGWVYALVDGEMFISIAQILEQYHLEAEYNTINSSLKFKEIDRTFSVDTNYQYDEDMIFAKKEFFFRESLFLDLERPDFEILEDNMIGRYLVKNGEFYYTPVYIAHKYSTFHIYDTDEKTIYFESIDLTLDINPDTSTDENVLFYRGIHYIKESLFK